MKKQSFILIIVILLILPNCKKDIPVKMFNEVSYLHVLQNIYFKINPFIINDFYKSSNSTISWSKYRMDVKDLGNVQLYISIEKVNKNLIEGFKSNMNESIKSYYSNENQIDYFGIEWDYNYSLNFSKPVSFIKHHNKIKRFKPSLGGWKKGYVEDIVGANTEINIFLINKNRLVNINMIVEYFPQLNTLIEAQGAFTTNTEKIVSILNNFKVN